MEQLFIPAAQLGGTVFTVVAFLAFLTRILNSQETSQRHRDKEAVNASNRRAKSDIVLAKSLQQLTDMVEVNNAASNKNTLSVKTAKVAIDKNTDVIDKNTEVISQNGNAK